MKIRSLGQRLMIATFLLVAIVCSCFGFVTWSFFSIRTQKDAGMEAERESIEILAHIASIDETSSLRIESAAQTLQHLGLAEGPASLKGTASLHGVPVPNLVFGNRSQIENFEVVDRIHNLMGGTATVFVWDGSNFTRIGTNVLKPDGSRALGTVLDPQGKAYAALSQGLPFKGVVNILGVPYTTSYLPMKDSVGHLIGAFYAGYRLDSLRALTNSMANVRILDRGFVALIDSNGQVLARSRHADGQTIERIRKSASGWVVRSDTYPAWNYQVLTAYPLADVYWRTVQMLLALSSETALLVGLILLLQHFLLTRLAVRPVQTLTARMDDADLGTVIEIAREDEIGDLAQSFNRFVARLRSSLLQVQDRASAAFEKSNEIHRVARSAVDGMVEQSRQAVSASDAVAQLSEQIAATSSHTGDASLHAQTAAEAAREGSSLVASTSAQMEQLAADTQESASRVASLNGRVQEIGSIVGVIEEIAAGTNLLALNASIEAARAGEQGRGFAVVAGEVRQLAERTAQATQQVASLVASIQEETGKVVSDINLACHHAEQGAASVSSLNRTFDRIASVIGEVNERIAHIAESARQEVSSADSANGTMQSVASSARNTASSAEQVVASSVELIGISNALREIVAQFHVQHTAN